MKLKQKLVSSIVIVCCIFFLTACRNTTNTYKLNIEESRIPNYANIMNFSLAYSSGEKNYYVNKMKHPQTGIIKKYIVVDDNQGKQLEILDVNALTFVIYDYLIYYFNEDDHRAIYKMNLDGSNCQKVTDEFGDNMNYYDGWIYYIDFGDEGNEGNMYKMSIAGEERTLISTDSCWELNVVDDWIYYVKGDVGFTLFKMKTDGTEDQLLMTPADAGGSITHVAYHSGYVYFISESGLGRIDLNSKKTELIYTDLVQTYNFYKDKILFIDQRMHTLCIMNLDGSNKKTLQTLDTEYLNVAGDLVYYKIKGLGGKGQNKLYIPKLLKNAK